MQAVRAEGTCLISASCFGGRKHSLLDCSAVSEGRSSSWMQEQEQEQELELEQEARTRANARASARMRDDVW
jgi:hypothetical protein